MVKVSFNVSLKFTLIIDVIGGLNNETCFYMLIKMKVKKLAILIICIIVLLIPMTFAIKAKHPKNIHPDPSFESKGITKHLRDMYVYDVDENGVLDGSIEITKEESFRGRRCVHLYGDGVDYPRIYTYIDDILLDEIASVSFWYKHDMESEPNTPYAIMGFWITDGEYEGGQLNIYQWYQTLPDPCLEWTFQDYDSWHIRVYMPEGGYFDDWGPYTLDEIKDMYDASMFRAGVAIGGSGLGFGGSADVYVDFLQVKVS